MARRKCRAQHTSCRCKDKPEKSHNQPRFAVCAALKVAPSDNKAFLQDGSKADVSCLDLMHTHQLLLYLAAVTAQCVDRPKSPQSHRSAKQQKHNLLLVSAGHAPTALAHARCHRHCLDVPKSPQSRPPGWQQKHSNSRFPQVTTEPSSRMAAKAARLDCICWTRISCTRTWLLSPPQSGSPLKSPLSRLPEWKQTQNELLGSAGPPATALAPGCCHLRTN